MKYKPYAKVVDLPYAICAIYEPHPFRSNVISEAVGFDVDMFTIENLGGFSWTTIECAQNLVDYLNKE